MCKKLSIIVPCFNEEPSIMIFYSTVTKILEEIGLEYEILFIDDGSRDHTLDEIKKLISNDRRISLIGFSRNFGKEAALLAGLEFSVGDAVVVMDADLQDPPELLPELVAYWQEGNDVVYTRRINRDGEPPIRSWCAEKFYEIINQISDVSIVNGARDYRIMSRTVVESVLKMRENSRFSKGLFNWVGYSSKCIEYRHVPRAAGSSSWSFFSLFNYAIEGIVSFSTAPLKIATYLGVSIGVLAIIYMLFLVVNTILYGNEVKGYPSLISIILFSTAIQLFFLGVIGEYLSRMFTEIKARPHYLVKNYVASELKQREAHD